LGEFFEKCRGDFFGEKIGRNFLGKIKGGNFSEKFWEYFFGEKFGVDKCWGLLIALLMFLNV
jgi:hypothetical protein